MAWDVDDLVDVRATAALPWQPGVVRMVEGNCYAVELDTPITADAWTGTTRKYGGSDLVGGPPNYVLVQDHVEKIVPDELIRSQGG